jgi:hypothetical protein
VGEGEPAAAVDPDRADGTLAQVSLRREAAWGLLRLTPTPLRLTLRVLHHMPVPSRTPILTCSHTCEHLLVAVKLPSGFPRDQELPWDDDENLRLLRRGVDTDVVVAEVRWVVCCFSTVTRTLEYGTIC